METRERLSISKMFFKDSQLPTLIGGIGWLLEKLIKKLHAKDTLYEENQ